MNMLNTFIYDSVYHTAPILLCVLGGIFAYKANVLNIALEGIMMAGAFLSVLIPYLTGNIALGYLGAIIGCMLLGLIFTFMGVNRKGNVIIIGLAINMLVPAIAGFVLQYMKSPNINLVWFSVSSLKLTIPIIHDIPVLGPILSGHPPITYISFIFIGVMALLMSRTTFGVHVRVVGENEDAAESLGLKTKQLKTAAVLLGSFCCALAGINLSLERMALYTNNMTAGRGFIAIAAIYCGRGEPVPSAVYAILFGIARALAINLGLFAGPAATLFDVVPYIVMTIVLSVVSLLKNRKVLTRGIG